MAFPWWAYALFSAFAAAATAILAKLGLQGLPSNLATAVRTVVVLIFSWALVFIAGDQGAWRDIKGRSLLFLVLSGLATGLSWLAYFKALQLAPVSKVAPLDKLSLPLSVALAALLLGEAPSWRLALGVGLMTLGALLTIGA
jgi:transporter family protein